MMAKSKSDFLAAYADPGYTVPENWTKDALTLVECKRIAQNAMIARAASDVPRRIGADAGAAELMADKKLTKRLAYIYQSLWARFVYSSHAALAIEECPDDLVPPRTWQSLANRANADREMLRQGRTREFPVWWEEQRPRLLARRMVIASFALDSQNAAWGYRMVSGLTDELEWVDNKFEMYNNALDRIASRYSVDAG